MCSFAFKQASIHWNTSSYSVMIATFLLFDRYP